MDVRDGRPAFARPYVGVHRSTSLMSSSLLLQQCLECLLRLTWIVFVTGGRWPYSWCLVGCFCQDLFNIARRILVQLPSSFFSSRFVSVHVVHNKEFITFPSVFFLKVNIIAQLEFELALTITPRGHPQSTIKNAFQKFLFCRLKIYHDASKQLTSYLNFFSSICFGKCLTCYAVHAGQPKIFYFFCIFSWVYPITNRIRLFYSLKFKC